VFTLEDYWKILNYLGGTSVIDLDANTQVLASSEKSVSLNLFDNTIDQIPHMSDDYKRLKNFLVNWYASHRTMISTQKQAHDVFSLPDRDLSELIQSFGFIFSTTSLSFLTKANFFLDLVNLYKVKGTPQTLIDILQYFGLSDIDIAEYWLEKDSSGNLVFKSERYLPPGVLDISFANISFDNMTQGDPHWRLSESQIENLLLINKIGLPSKSPYFSIRPRYNLSTLKAVMSVVSRHVQDNYATYISGGTLTKDIKLTQINIYASFLDLYLACIYTFNEYYERTTGSSDPLFFCYDGTSVPRIEVVVNQYNNATSRIGSPSSTQNESRSAREAKILNFYDLFTRDMSTNFLTSHNTAGGILDTINDSLYDIIGVYISSGNGEEILGYLMSDLNDWIVSNIGAGYPSITTTVLGFGSLLEINKIINFFKPYHARMIKLEFALIIQDPLLDSIVVEDQFYDYITESVIDFDTANGFRDADSTACFVCSDSTCVSYYSRKNYDCGSQFDIGASIDDSPEIRTEDSIIDILNFHDETSSNAHEQILFTDTTNFNNIATFCDGSASLSIVLAGAWANFDESGVFDAQHGNDIVQIYIEDICVPTVWATTSSLTEVKQQLTGCGDISDALCFGRDSGGGGEVDTTEIWNGTIWATTSSLTEVKDKLTGCGNTGDALCFGGDDSGELDTTEIWNGSIWATTTSLTEVKDKLTGCGDISDALCFGGDTGDEVDTTEIWNGSIWATTTSLTEAKDSSGGCGNTGDALCFGGNTGTKVDTTEIWNGSTWATTSSLTESKNSNAGCGDASDALCFGGYTGNPINTTEIWIHQECCPSS